MDRAQRWFVGAVLPISFLGLTLLPWVLTRSDLPSPIAIHFGSGGAADGSAPLAVHLAVVFAFTVPASVVLLWAGWRPTSGVGVLAAIAAFLGWLVGVVNAMVLFANEGHTDWRDVELGSGAVWGATSSALGIALPVAFLVLDRQTPPVPDEVRVHPLRTSERAAWFGSASGLLVASSVVFLTFASSVVLLAVGSGAFATAIVVCAVVALGTVALLRVRVRVSEQGVEVAGGVAGWPRVRFSLEEIEGARAVDLDPVQPMTGAAGPRSWTTLGWGYRGSLRLFGNAAWVLRKGPALRLDLRRDRRFWVTVDDAEEAAAVVNGLLARARG